MVFSDLGVWVPTTYSERAIKVGIRKKLGGPRKCDCDVRSPDWHLVDDEYEAEWKEFGAVDVKQWHRDLGGERDWLVCVWASHKPTEVRYCNSQKRKELLPYHVYAFSNTFLHRTPELTFEDKAQRWWARVLLPMKANPEFIARLKNG